VRAPSDQIHGAATFHSRIERQPDGTYKATNGSIPDVPPQVAPTESEAINKLMTATQEWMGAGCRQSGK
jgi:hypothetical protein